MAARRYASRSSRAAASRDRFDPAAARLGVFSFAKGVLIGVGLGSGTLRASMSATLTYVSILRGRNPQNDTLCTLLRRYASPLRAISPDTGVKMPGRGFPWRTFCCPCVVLKTFDCTKRTYFGISGVEIGDRGVRTSKRRWCRFGGGFSYAKRNPIHRNMNGISQILWLLG